MVYVCVRRHSKHHQQLNNIKITVANILYLCMFFSHPFVVNMEKLWSVYFQSRYHFFSFFFSFQISDTNKTRKQKRMDRSNERKREMQSEKREREMSDITLYIHRHHIHNCSPKIYREKRKFILFFKCRRKNSVKKGKVLKSSIQKLLLAFIIFSVLPACAARLPFIILVMVSVVAVIFIIGLCMFCQNFSAINFATSSLKQNLYR